ncbi:MAG: FtsX-like permease family protein [Nocardioidaceae bacterium]
MGLVVRLAFQRRRVTVGLVAVAMALCFGGSMAALGGARRSSTAIARSLAYSPPEDVFVAPAEGSTLDMAEVVSLPEVLASAYEAYLAMVPDGPDGRPEVELAGKINPYLYQAVTGPAGAIDRLRIVRGRDLDPTKPLEVVIDEELAAERRLSVGSHLEMAAYSSAQMDTVFGNETSGAAVPAPEGPVLDLSVVGIARMPVDLHPGDEDHTTSFGGTKDIYLTPALFERYGDQIVIFGAPSPDAPQAVRLVHGLADLDSFSAGVHSLAGGDDAVIDVSDSDALGSARLADNAVGVETAALAALAALLAVAGIALVGQALARLPRSSTAELEILRALGLRPVELLLAAAVPGLVAVALGSVGAGVVSFAGSAFTPIGLGRLAEVAPGAHFDAAVSVLGVAVVIVLGGGTALMSARPTALSVSARRRAPRSGSRVLADRLASWGAPFGPTMGARFATSGHQRDRGAPLRSAMLSSAVAIVVLVGVVTFTSSLQRLSGSPAAQGANWDLSIGNINLSDYGPDDYAELGADPHIAGVGAVAAPQGRGSVEGHDVTIVGLDVVSGGVGPRIVTGRPPSQEGEVVLGHRTAGRLGVAVGAHVRIGYRGAEQDAEVVGTALLGPGLAPALRIGEGALVTVEQMRALAPEQRVTFLLARVKPGVSVGGAVAALQGRWGRNVARPVLAADVVNLRRVRAIPVALALALGATAAILLAAALVLSVRHRRLDIGVLRALGATGRQLTSALTWQALWLYGGAALVGLPLGVIAGRMAWRGIAEGVDALVGPVVPVGDVGLIAVGGLVVVSCLVIVPALLAVRQRPSLALRTE